MRYFHATPQIIEKLQFSLLAEVKKPVYRKGTQAWRTAKVVVAASFYSTRT